MAHTQTQLTESFSISNNGPGINKEEQIITQFLLNPEKHHEILNKASFEEKKKLHKALKTSSSKAHDSYKRCSKICSFLIFSIFAGTNFYFIFYSFEKEWIQITTGFLIFTCLLFADFMSIFKTYVPCCSQKMAEMIKFIVYVMGFVVFAGLSLFLSREGKKYEIAIGICGTMLGFFLATVFGKELKKFSKKAF